MKTISLIGFQGAGFKENSPYANQPSLIRAGHVGMIFEGEPILIADKFGVSICQNEGKNDP